MRNMNYSNNKSVCNKSNKSLNRENLLINDENNNCALPILADDEYGRGEVSVQSDLMPPCAAAVLRLLSSNLASSTSTKSIIGFNNSIPSSAIKPFPTAKPFKRPCQIMITNNNPRPTKAPFISAYNSLLVHSLFLLLCYSMVPQNVATGVSEATVDSDKSHVGRLEAGCGLQEMPVMVQNNGPGETPPFVIICQRSHCLKEASNITCVTQSAPCEMAHEWMRGWTSSAQQDNDIQFTCCRSPNVLRSLLTRTAPIVPGHTGLMRGFEEILPGNVYFQFGEALTNIQIKAGGAILLGVSRFKCGQDVTRMSGEGYGDYYSTEEYEQRKERRKRQIAGGSLIEPLDKPACDSEWESSTINSLPSNREGRDSFSGSVVSKITDVSYCGVQVTKSREVTLTF